MDEGVDVWRPARARRRSDEGFLIVDQDYERDTEKWQFEPGDVVTCEIIESAQGPILAATRIKR